MIAAPAETTKPATPAIRMEGIEKSFGPVRANRGAAVEVMPGEIHALVGEKSARAKFVVGLEQPVFLQQNVDIRH